MFPIILVIAILALAPLAGIVRASTPVTTSCSGTAGTGGQCLLQASQPFSTAYTGPGNGGFASGTSSPPNAMPVTSNVQAYNNNGNPQWLITCPTQPNPQNGYEYIAPTPNPLLGGDVCQATSAPLDSAANLYANVQWGMYSFAGASGIYLSFTNPAELNVQNLAYSGEAYNGSRGIASANVSSGYNSQSNIFGVVPPSNQHGIWTWNSKVADFSNPIIAGMSLSNQQTLDFYNQQCEYAYDYSLSVTLNKANNIAIPVPVTGQPTTNYLSFNNQTYNGINAGTPPGLSTITPNAVAMAECYLPNFWGSWHLVGTNGQLNYPAGTTAGHCVYQYGSTPYYFTNYGTGSSAAPVYAQYNSMTFSSAEQLPAFLYYATMPAAYSSESSSFAFYNSSYYLYSNHNLQSPGNFLNPVTLHVGPSIFLNDNNILAELSYDSFFGGNYYAPSSSPPGLNLQAKAFPSYQCSSGGCPGGLSSVPNPVFAAESNNNNLFVIGKTSSGYSLYNLQLVPPGQLNLSYNTPASATSNYQGTPQGYNSMLQAYWNAVEYNQSFPAYITKVQSLPVTPLALATDYAGDVFVLSANIVQYCPFGPCTPVGGTGFNLLYISANGVELTASVASGPSSSLMQQFGKDIGSTQYASPSPAYMAASPDGRYIYVAEQNISDVLVYSVTPAGVSLATGSGSSGGPKGTLPPQISISPSTALLGQNVVITGTCATAADTCTIDYPSVITPLQSYYPQDTSCNLVPGQTATCTFNTIALGGSGTTYTFYSYTNFGPNRGAWASANLIVVSTPQYVLDASFITAINLSYSTKQYNMSIDEYLLNGGPFNSQAISQNTAAYINQKGVPPSYQWYSSSSCASGTEIGGATSQTYSASPTSATTYCVEVANPGSSPTTTTSGITVTSPSGTSVSPSSATVDSGQSITLTAVTSGSPSGLSYQWYSGSAYSSSSCSSPIGAPTPIGGATSATYTTPSVNYNNFLYQFTYCVEVTGLAGTTTATSKITVSPQSGGYSVSPSYATIDSGQSITLTALGVPPGTSLYSCQYYLNDTPGYVPCTTSQPPGTLNTGIWHMPLGLAVSGSTLYVLDNWLFSFFNNDASRSSDSLLMMRAFYLNGTEIPIHPSNVVDVVARPFGSPLPATGPIAKGEYPPYGWPLSAAFTLRNNNGNNYLSYCAYLCDNTPQYTSDSRGVNVIYGGYPPIGPQIQANGKGEYSGSPYYPPSPLSFSSDFNNTVYLDLWSNIEVSGTSTACPGVTYQPNGYLSYIECHLYTELLAVHASVDNYTKTSNASASPPYGCYSLQAGGPQQCGYLNNNYTAMNGIAPVPNAYFCYMGVNEIVAGLSGSPSTAPSPCAMVDNLSLQAPPFIGIPDSFKYVESLGSPDTYLTFPNILNAYLPAGGGGASGSGGSSSGTYPPTLSVSPSTALLGQNIIITTTCTNNLDTCDIEYPQGTTLQSTYPGYTSCNPSSSPGVSVSGNPGWCTFNTIALGQDGNYVFYSSVTAGPDSGSYSSANLIVSNSIETELANVIANSENAVTGQIPVQFLIPSYLKSNIGGALLVPYTYTYTETQQWCAPGTSGSGMGASDMEASGMSASSCQSTDPTITLTPACYNSISGVYNSITLPSVQGPTTYNVFTTQAVPASSTLNEQLQGGQIIPQYQNTLKYYIANLSDQNLIMPPQAYLNVFTDRAFGEIYANQSMWPQGYALLLIPPGGQGTNNYLLGSLVANAIHIHDYEVVNTVQVSSYGQAPGYSVEDVLDQPPTPFTTHYNVANAINASWTVDYNGVNGQPVTVTLQSPVFAHDIFIDSRVTLITEGYSLVATNSIVNNGKIVAGYANNAGLYGGSGGNLPYSYGGSGGGAAACSAAGCAVGGNTLAPGGAQNRPGSTPALPPPPITISTLSSWAYDPVIYLAGVGGASSSYASSGGEGSFGIFMQAPTLLLKGGLINTMGQNGMQGSGGGGGGVIVLAYNSLLSISASDYQDSGGTGGPSGPTIGAGQPGGAGSYVPYQYSLSGAPVLLTRFNMLPPLGAACGDVCLSVPYYYTLAQPPFVVTTEGHVNGLCGTYPHVFCGNSIFTAMAIPQKSVLQLFSALKTYISLQGTSIDLTYNPQILGYNRLNYTFADEFNNIINMPIDADLANITTISLNAQTTINAINPNETAISISGTAGYYPSIYAATPSPVPDGSDIYLYYDTNINYFNITNSIIAPLGNPDTNQYPNLNIGSAPTSPCYGAASTTGCSYIDWAQYCAFGLSPTGVGNVPAGGCAAADPTLTTNLPIGQGSLAPLEANVINFHTQYNSIGECSPEPNSLLLPTGTNTQECNIYPDNPFGLPTSGNTVPINGQRFPEYCVPYNNNGNGVLTSQLGLMGVVQTTHGKFSYSTNVCGTGTARIQAGYYGYPPGQPVQFLQMPLQSITLAQPVKIMPFVYRMKYCPQGQPEYDCVVVSNTPLVNTVEFNYSVSPNTTLISFPIGTYYLSFGDIAGWLALAVAASLVSYVLLREWLPVKS